MSNPTLPLPNPADWMTTNAAAHLLHVDRRTIGRMIDKGTLTGYKPYGAPNETVPVILWREEVLAVLGARNRLAGAAR